MSIISPLQTIAVGVVVERSKSTSPWIDFLWRPLSVLTGAPATPPWTKLSDDGERTTFFAGTADNRTASNGNDQLPRQPDERRAVAVGGVAAERGRNALYVC